MRALNLADLAKRISDLETGSTVQAKNHDSLERQTAAGLKEFREEMLRLANQQVRHNSAIGKLQARSDDTRPPTVNRTSSTRPLNLADLALQVEELEGTVQTQAKQIEELESNQQEWNKNLAYRIERLEQRPGPEKQAATDEWL